MDEVELLRCLRFSWSKIAAILAVSRSTLYRRLAEEGISIDTFYANLSDSQLDIIVARIKQTHPNDGEVLMAGHLASRGILIPRSRLRAAIHRVDPSNTAARRSITIRRRVYVADGPNAIWHLDGNHKLIRWRFVHGAIDGYSRTVVFLKCSTNNRAATVLASFVEAAEIHGLPYRVRTDLGGENTDVWHYMIEQHQDSAAVITGSSMHTQ